MRTLDMRALAFGIVGLSACAGDVDGRARSRASTAVAEALIRADYDDALRRADAVLVRHPGDPWILYDKGSALAALQRTDDALGVLHEAERRFPKRERNGRSVAIFRRAIALERAGRCGEAATELSRYAERAPPRSPEPDVAAHLEDCVGSTVEELARRGETAALKAARDDEHRQAVLAASSAAGEAMVADGYDAALARAEAGLAVDPEDAWLLYDKGAALAALGRVEESLAVLRDAEARFASDPHGRAVAIYGRALALESIGRCEEAAAEYRRYAAVAGDSDPRAEEHARTHLRMCKTSRTAD